MSNVIHETQDPITIVITNEASNKSIPWVVIGRVISVEPKSVHRQGYPAHLRAISTTSHSWIMVIVTVSRLKI